MSSHSHSVILTLENTRVKAKHPVFFLEKLFFILFLLSAVATGFLAQNNVSQFFFSLHTSFIYFLSLAIGACFFVLIQLASNAGWSVVIRRLLEITMSLLPFFSVYLIVLFLGKDHLFHWMHPGDDAVLLAKAAYLNPTFFFIRAVIYFVSWALLSRFFLKRSLSQDQLGASAPSLNAPSYPAMIIMTLTTTFAAFDWIMSLDPHWFSTIFGVYFFAGSVLAAYALSIVLSFSLRNATEKKGIVTVEHFHDMGKLMFAHVAFWAYIAFSQYFLIWYANIPEETVWYAHRMAGSWKNVSMVLAIGHFVIPFVLLLPRSVKRIPALLCVLALFILAMHFVDMYWLIMPTHSHEGFHFHALDVSCFVAVGSLFSALLLRSLKRYPLVPIGDGFLQESLDFENI